MRSPASGTLRPVTKNIDPKWRVALDEVLASLVGSLLVPLARDRENLIQKAVCELMVRADIAADKAYRLVKELNDIFQEVVCSGREP